MTHAERIRGADRAVVEAFRCNYPLDEIDIWARMLVTDGCWHWIGGVDGSRRSGYGRVTWRGKGALAHRVVYELLRGPIPGGMTLDHLCRNRACVNPDHLEPVTSVENVMRGESPQAKNARRTHCIHGHELVGSNLIVAQDGHRACRACAREREKRRAPRDRRKVGVR